MTTTRTQNTTKKSFSILQAVNDYRFLSHARASSPRHILYDLMMKIYVVLVCVSIHNVCSAHWLLLWGVISNLRMRKIINNRIGTTNLPIEYTLSIECRVNAVRQLHCCLCCFSITGGAAVAVVIVSHVRVIHAVYSLVSHLLVSLFIVIVIYCFCASKRSIFISLYLHTWSRQYTIHLDFVFWARLAHLNRVCTSKLCVSMCHRWLRLTGVSVRHHVPFARVYALQLYNSRLFRMLSLFVIFIIIVIFSSFLFCCSLARWTFSVKYEFIVFAYWRFVGKNG